jgi:hypothetical protein
MVITVKDMAEQSRLGSSGESWGPGRKMDSTRHNEARSARVTKQTLTPEMPPLLAFHLSFIRPRFLAQAHGDDEAPLAVVEACRTRGDP